MTCAYFQTNRLAHTIKRPIIPPSIELNDRTWGTSYCWDDISWGNESVVILFVSDVLARWVGNYVE